MPKREVGFVVTDDYKVWIDEVKKKIRNSQIKASVKINYEMLDLYWKLGNDICEKQKQAKWGDAFLKVMSNDLQKAFPGVSGFSVENLKHIRYWYNFYTNNEKGLQPVTQIEKMVKSIPWGHNQRIMYKCKDVQEALFQLGYFMFHQWLYVHGDIYEPIHPMFDTLVCDEVLQDMKECIAYDEYTVLMQLRGNTFRK